MPDVKFAGAAADLTAVVDHPLSSTQWTMSGRRLTPSERSHWAWYQARVAALFRLVPGAVVNEDVHEVGQDSGERRQLDVLVTLTLGIDLGKGFGIEVPIKIVVDAKAHDRALDIPAIDKVIGLRQDVRANLAIVVTPKGVSKGAMKRAKAGGVYPIVVTGDFIALMGGLKLPEYTPCGMCEYGLEDDYSPPEVSWRSDIEGYCNWCNTLHVRCPDCLEIFAIPETQYDMGIRCATECGAIFRVSRRGDPKDQEIALEVFDGLSAGLLLAAFHKSTARLTSREVSRVISGTRWQHWDAASPTINLTEEGLMQWGEDECLHLTSEGRTLVQEVLLEPEYAYWQ